MYVNVEQRWTVIKPTKNQTQPPALVKPPSTNDEMRAQIQAARVDAQISLSKLAQMVGLPLQTLCDVERGVDTLSDELYRRIMFALKKPDSS